MLNRNILVGASALVFALGIASVQAAPKKQSHSAASIECSNQANAKGLHGKARKKFREACKRQFRHTEWGTQKGYGYGSKGPTSGSNPSSGSNPNYGSKMWNKMFGN